MSTCPQCGTVAKPTDKFCNVCGTPIARAAAPATPAQGAYGAPPQGQYGTPPGQPPQAQGGFGAPAAARCQMGHEISPGASYCAQGHPIALDQMQFAGDPYGAGGGAYGAPPPGQGQGFGAPPPGPGGFGAPPPAFGAPPGQPGAYGAPPAPQGFGGPPPGGFGAPPPSPGGFGAPPPAASPGGFGAPPPAYAAAPAYAPPAAAPPAYTPPAAPAPAPAPMAVPAAPAPAFGASAEPAGGSGTLRGFLVAYGSNPVGDFWPLKGGRVIVGRAGTGDGVEVAVQDPTISSRHAALVVDGASGSISVEDTGSTNGTFVNDEHIGFNGRRDLRDGDRVRFGGYITVVKVIGRV